MLIFYALYVLRTQDNCNCKIEIEIEIVYFEIRLEEYDITFVFLISDQTVKLKRHSFFSKIKRYKWVYGYKLKLKKCTLLKIRKLKLPKQIKYLNNTTQLPLEYLELTWNKRTYFVCTFWRHYKNYFF